MSGPLHIDIEEARALPYASRQTLLTCIAEDMERAECIAALSRGKARREALAYAKQCNAALFQISEIDARPSQRLSDSELLGELLGEDASAAGLKTKGL